MIVPPVLQYLISGATVNEKVGSCVEGEPLCMEVNLFRVVQLWWVVQGWVISVNLAPKGS